MDVSNTAEAIKQVNRCPNPMLEPSVIQIKQLHKGADFVFRRRASFIMVDCDCHIAPRHQPPAQH